MTTESAYRVVFANAPVGMYRANSDGDIVLANPALLKMLGYETFEQLAADDVSRGGIRCEIDREAFRGMLERDEVRNFESRWWTRNGSSVMLCETVARDGEFYEGVVVDAGERTALRESRERYSHIIENANDIIYRTDDRGHFEFVNPAAMRITGYDENELIGRHFLDLIDPEYREIADHFYRSQFTAREESSYFEFPMIAKSGTRIWIGQNVLALIDEATDRVLGFEAVARDITAGKHMAEELAAARDAAVASARSKSEFLANVSHEIRTPLNGVLGMTNLLLGTSLTPEQREYADAIRTSGQALLAVVNDVLDLARVESGKLTIETIDFDLDDLIETVTDIFAARAAAKRLKFRTHIASDVPRYLRGDSHRINQVLLNLVGNAIKFTDRGEVVLTIMQAAREDATARLRFLVTDTGIGIPAGVQKRLFTPFTQADGTTTRKYGGSGLGLAVAKQMTEAMGGEIGVMSIAGEGSTFWFELPLLMQEQVEDKAATRWNLSEYRALLVDGNDVHRLMIARHLGYTAIAVDEVTGAGEALAAAYRRKYDVIIFDMQLPDDDGLSLARSIRKDPALATARLVLLTSFGRRRSDVIAFENAGIDRFLVKPIRRSQLCDTVARLLTGEGGPVAKRRPSGEFAVQKRAKVLLVEDNSVNQLVALGQLRKLGHDCVIAASGAEALAAVPEGEFDVVLMDCSMPEMDGYETTRRLRQLGGAVARIPVIAITAHALPGEREKCLAAGMNDYLAKPVSIEQLGAMIKLWTSKDSTIVAPSAAVEEQQVMVEDDHFVLDRERVSSFMTISRTQPGFLDGLVRTFKQDVPSRLDALRAAAASGDADDLANAAHALKSSCGSVGARRMFAVAATLEQKVRAGKMEGVNASIDQLAAEFPRVLEAYSGIIRRSGQHRAARS
jgi:two-component system, sensor histidine kinase and response regulator